MPTFYQSANPASSTFKIYGESAISTHFYCDCPGPSHHHLSLKYCLVSQVVSRCPSVPQLTVFSKKAAEYSKNKSVHINLPLKVLQWLLTSHTGTARDLTTAFKILRDLPPSVISYHSFLCLVCVSHTGLLSSPQTCQAWSHFKVFANAIPPV